MAEDDDFIPDEMMEGLDDRVYASIDMAAAESEAEEDTPVQEIPSEETYEPVETVIEPEEIE